MLKYAMKPLLVLGIGNILLRDEGVGVHVIETIEADVAAGKLRLPDDVELYDGGTFGIDLIDVISGRRKVVCIDAVCVDAPPGTILKFSGDDLARKEVPDLSLHQVGLLETLAMARQLGSAPGEVVIFGIVPETIHSGLEMTTRVAAAVPKVIDMVLKELA
jgi:hydrogenase maturation protease